MYVPLKYFRVGIEKQSEFLIKFKDIKTKGNFQGNKRNEIFSQEIYLTQNFKRDA